jgi:NitT/TauT family transport system substrate-binding protein
MRIATWLLLAITLGLLALGGCRKEHPANGLFPVRLQTDWYPQPEHGGFYEAQIEGLYKAEGLEVTIAPGGPYITSDQQVSTGQAQFGMASSDRVLTSVARGLPMVAVAATMQQDPQALMVHADSPVHTFADLEGHAVAVQPGASFFQYILRRYNLHNVREMPATYSVANFLEDPGYIQQCFVTSEPYFAEKAGAKVRTLLISSSGYQPYRVFFTSTSFLNEHPEIVVRFVRASIQGWKDYLRDPTQVNAEIGRLNPAMSASQMNFSIQTLRDQHFIDGDGTPDSHLGHFTAARWTTTYHQLLDLKVLANPIDPATAYTLRFAP